MARRSIGFSRRDLAARIDVDVQVIKRMERRVGSASTFGEAMQALDPRLTGVGRGITLLERLRAHRVSRAISLREAAAQTDMSRAAIDSLERGGGKIVSLLPLLAVLAPFAPQ